MASVEESVEVRAPIDAVFTQVTDPRRVPEWNTAVIEVHDVEYPIRVGSAWAQTISVLGRPANVTCTVTQFEPPRFGEILVAGDQQARLWTRCDSGPSGTRLTQGVEFEPPGGRIRAIVGKAVTSRIRHELRATMARQRETLEREAGETNGSGA